MPRIGCCVARDQRGCRGCCIAAYTLLPFRYKAVPRDEYLGREDVGTGPLGVIGNIVWLLRAGW
jgi:uncharacterized membrane protein YccF (DUF307 family)